MAEMSEYFSSESGTTLLGLLNSFEGRPYVSAGEPLVESHERCLKVDDPKGGGG